MSAFGGGSINARARPWGSKPLPIDYKRCCTDRLSPPGESGHYSLSGNELLRDLPLERDAVRTLSGHGFHYSKAQHSLSNH